MANPTARWTLSVVRLRHANRENGRHGAAGNTRGPALGRATA